MDSIDNFTVFPSKRADSDHVPVSFSIKTSKTLNFNDNPGNIKNETTPGAYKWDSKKQIDYQETFKQEPCTVLINKLLEGCSVTSSEDMSNIFYEYLKHAIGANFTRKRIRTATKFPQNKWEATTCKKT